MRYRIIVLDLDGTLTNSRKQITARTEQTLIAFQERGGTVILASGRPVYGIWPLAQQLRLRQYGGYIMAFNGGEIVACGSGEILYKKAFPRNSVREMELAAQQHGTAVLTYQNDLLLTNDGSNCYVRQEAAITGMKIKQTDDLAAAVELPVTKFLLLEHEDHLVKVEQEMLQQYGRQYAIYRSEPFFLEIMPAGIDKAASLQWLLHHMEAEREETAVFGDGFNDLTMIEYGGLGVAMDNAQPSVKQRADYIAPTNDDDGVAWVVDTLIMDDRESWPVNQVRKLAVFDLDGTLNQIETFALPAIRDALKLFDRHHITDQQILASFGARDEDTNKIFFDDGNDSVYEAFWKKVDEFSADRYKDCYQAYEGTAEMLQELKVQGYDTAVCSNARLPYIMMVLEKIGIAAQIDYIQPLLDGMDKRLTLALLLKRCSPETVYMAGDRYFDCEAAAANGVPFIACSYGFGDETELRGAAYRAASVSEIAEIIRTATM